MTVEDIKNAKNICRKLDELCEQYFAKKHDTDWEHYSGWEFTYDGMIKISYYYTTYLDEHEAGWMYINYETLINFQNEKL